MKYQVLILAAGLIFCATDSATAGNKIGVNNTGAVRYLSYPSKMTCQYVRGTSATACAAAVLPMLRSQQYCDVGTVRPAYGGRVICTPEYGAVYNAFLVSITCPVSRSSSIDMTPTGNCVCDYSDTELSVDACRWL